MIRLPLTVGAVALLLAGCSALSGNEFVDEDLHDKGESADQAFIRSLMTGLGGVDSQRAPIKYEPRSPLVVPPSRSLPEPSDKMEAKVEDNAAWPKDPDAMAAKYRAEAEASRPKDESDLADHQTGRPWSPEELAKYRIPGAGKKGDYSGETRDGKPLTREEMAKTSAKASAASGSGATGSGTAAGPQRKYLTEPPSEYRVPASTAPMRSAKKEPEKREKYDQAIGGYAHNN